MSQTELEINQSLNVMNAMLITSMQMIESGGGIHRMTLSVEANIAILTIQLT
jgi:hypothetical protein